MAEIEAEMGEPLADTIMGLREQGNSWRTVAGALGVNLGTLVLWRKLLGLPMEQNHKVFDPSSLPELTPLDRRARALGYADMREAVLDLRVKQHKTLREAAAILGCHYTTVSSRTPPEARGTYNLTAAGQASLLASAERLVALNRAREASHQHPWRDDENARRAKIHERG
ncbi:MAG TPA: hypothetical protein PK406_00720 [Verrucomicrobiota bacterium]|nr:hypothetical protein [Verrucomicrobiota bacterium]